MDPRQTALATMLANAGNNRVAQDPAMWRRVVAPAFTKPTGSVANQITDMWNTRNKTVGDARNTEIASLFGALDALGQRQLEDAKKNQQPVGSGGGGGGRGGGGRTTPPPIAPPTPTTSSWWFDQFINGLPPIPTGAPTYRTGPAPSRPVPDRIDRIPTTPRRTPTSTPRRTTPTIPRTGAF